MSVREVLVERATRPWLAVPVVTLVALGLGIYRLGAKSIGLDESTSIMYARGTLLSLRHTLRETDPNMGLYYVLLWVWEHVVGEGERAVRAPSAVFAAATVPALYLVGNRLFGRRAGLLAALLLALDEFVVRWAQQARSYSLVLLLVTLSTYFFVREIEEPSRWTRAGYVLASALAVYAHYFAAWVLLTQLLVLALRRTFDRRWLLLTAAIGLLCLPEVLAASRKGTGGISWIREPDGQKLLHTARGLAGGSYALLVLFLVCGCFAARRNWRFALAVGWFAVPLLGSFAASFVQPMFIDYYVIVAIPGLMLVAAAGIVRLPGPLAVATVVAFVSLSAVRLSDGYAAPPLEDWRAATQYVLDRTHPGDAVAFYPTFVDLPFLYYERREPVAAPESLNRDNRILPFGTHQRIWLVFRVNDALFTAAGSGALARDLARRYVLTDRHRVKGVTVELYRLRA